MPQHVRPFVKRQKNDTADAETIVLAARQSKMRFLVAKTAARFWGLTLKSDIAKLGNLVH